MVTSTADGGLGSLRHLIDDVTCLTITFNISGSSPVITLEDHQLLIGRSVTIQGPNLHDGSPVTIHGGGPDGTRIFQVDSGVSDVVLRGLTITGGNGTTPGGGFSNDSGGGILNNGELTIIDSRITGNVMVDEDSLGGGIATVGGTLHIERSEISGNSAGNVGGGIAVRNSTVTITSSTISGNSAEFGGAIDVWSSSIDNLSNVTILTSTITSNSTSESASADIDVFFGAMMVTGSILAGSGTSDVCYRPVKSGGFNITTGNMCFAADVDTSATPALPSDRHQTNPQRGTLSFTAGGPTQTHLPAANSPAIDVAGYTSCTGNDQRGTPRPQNGLCDIGAVERQVFDTTGWVVTSLADPVDADLTKATLRQAINAAPSGTEITFAAGLSGTIQLASQLDITRNVTITGPTGEGIVIKGTSTNRGMQVTDGAEVTISNLTIQDGQVGTGGGGIQVSNSTLTLLRSTIAGNSGSAGAGIHAVNTDLTLIASTISGNTTTGAGGGIFSQGGTLTILSSTIVFNESLSGSAIWRTSVGFTVDGSIIEGTCPGIVDSGSYNIGTVDDANRCVPAGADNTITTSGELLLGTLANNGGPTLTRLPAAGSPAVGALADTGLCAEPDQRGTTRFPINCTIGAVEVRNETIVTNTSNDVAEPNSLPWAVANSEPNGLIRFDIEPVDDEYTIELASQLVLNKNLTIQGTNMSDGNAIVINAAPASRVLTISGGFTVTLRGLTITGGDVTGDGGGILVTGAGTTLYLENSIVAGNEASGNGGVFPPVLARCVSRPAR